MDSSSNLLSGCGRRLHFEVQVYGQRGKFSRRTRLVGDSCLRVVTWLEPGFLDESRFRIQVSIRFNPGSRNPGLSPGSNSGSEPVRAKGTLKGGLKGLGGGLKKSLRKSLRGEEGTGGLKAELKWT